MANPRLWCFCYNAIHASSSSESELEAARVQRARLMGVCHRDPGAAAVTAQKAIRMKPDLESRIEDSGHGISRFMEVNSFRSVPRSICLLLLI